MQVGVSSSTQSTILYPTGYIEPSSIAQLLMMKVFDSFIIQQLIFRNITFSGRLASCTIFEYYYPEAIFLCSHVGDILPRKSPNYSCCTSCPRVVPSLFRPQISA